MSRTAGSSTNRVHPTRRQQATALSRRGFCGGVVAAAAAIAVVPRQVLGGNAHTPPSQRLNLALIGAGCHGLRHLRVLLAEQPDVQVVAVCDVNAGSADYHDFDYADGIAGRDLGQQIVDRHYAKATQSGTYKSCAAYRDFREMLEKEGSIDAVLIATPDHTHAVAAMHAIKLGRHVYCEKPLTHTIQEARKLAEATRAAKVATQMGIQCHASENLRFQVEVIRSGMIGQVREVHAWCPNTGWHGPWSPITQRRWAAVGSAWHAGPDRPADTPPVPAGLDWDLWLGPAPYRPYHPAYLPFKWRGWWDFGSGTLGDMGCHILDPVFWALELKAPATVEASAVQFNSETCPTATTIHYEFPTRGDLPPLRLTWYDGGLKPPRPEELEDGRDLPNGGLLYVADGRKMLVPYTGTPRLLPKSRMKDFHAPKQSLPRIGPETKGTGALGEWLVYHQREWINACKGGPAPLANFEYAARLTETVLLGVVAIRTGKKLYWDTENMKTANAPAANAYVCPPYREGWAL